mgnify:CR=1 FL=1
MLEAVIILGIFVIALAFLHVVLLGDMRSLRRDIERRLREGGKTLIGTSSSNREVVSLVNVTNALFAHKEKTQLEAAQLQQKTRENIANISHDLRTPLTAIMGYCNLLDKSALPDDSKEHVHIIKSKSNVLNKLVNDFYEYSRIVSKDYPIKLKQIWVEDMLRETLFEFFDEFAQKDIDLRLNIPTSTTMVLSDADALRRILNNLMTNMLRHGEGDYSIGLVKKASTVCLIFQNKVTGLSEETISRLFDRSYTAAASRTSGSTGLGLSIAKELALLMGHELRCSLEEDLFTIEVVIENAR